MKTEIFGIIKETSKGPFVSLTGQKSFAVVDVVTGQDISGLFRADMVHLAREMGNALKYDTDTKRAKRIDPADIPADITKLSTTKTESVKNTTPITDPVMQLIAKAPSIKPADLEMSDIKWKYLVRSAVRGKNIMMVGPAGCGKTQAAKALPVATGHPFFYFNLGATQDPRATLIGNTHFKDGQTVFDSSAFVKAIQTENAVILLDELSRAHPEAWNILMTVLDDGQRYLRLDENIDSPTIMVAKGVSFIATANIGTEYTSTRVLDRALMDRFEIIEVDILGMDKEVSLLTRKFGERVSKTMIEAVADIAVSTRKEWKSEEGKLSTMISTRMTVRVCDLLADGFTLNEAAEVAILPFFDASGGSDSERTFVKQIIQKHIATEEADIFNTGNYSDTATETIPF